MYWCLRTTLINTYKNVISKLDYFNVVTKASGNTFNKEVLATRYSMRSFITCCELHCVMLIVHAWTCPNSLVQHYNIIFSKESRLGCVIQMECGLVSLTTIFSPFFSVCCSLSLSFYLFITLIHFITFLHLTYFLFLSFSLSLSLYIFFSPSLSVLSLCLWSSGDPVGSQRSPLPTPGKNERVT